MTKLLQLGPGNWRVLVEGNRAAYLAAGGRNERILEHALGRMVAGDAFSTDELAYWGIEVCPVDDADEDDVAAALKDSYVADQLAGIEPAALLEFHNRMLRARLGDRDD